MTNTVITSAGKTGKDRAIVMGGSIAGLVASRVLSDYFHKVNMAARYDMSAVMAFQKAKNLLAPPQSLLKPSLMARVLSAAFSLRPVTRTSAKSAQQTA
jgi:hypothetical protein